MLSRLAGEYCIFLIGKIRDMPTTKIQTLTRVSSVDDLGAVVRSSRRSAGVDQATAAGLAGVGARFLGDLERGKPNLRLGLVLQVLDRLGLELWVAPRGWRDRGP
ncbi:MAG: helix-turn-helix transcriptional regulator [Myxococcales bacterium]|nr:helix-turn-helix transcriptional regulator [Myxococcales bacterium]